MTGGRDELARLLRRTGPRAAWRPVIADDARPTATVRGVGPDVVGQVNAEWHRLAVKHRIIDENSVFLIDVAGSWTGCAPRRWTRVRLTTRWDLAGMLGEHPGEPEFVTVSTDGEALLGATSEEYEVWLVAVDRLRARQEEAAQAAAQETPGEWEAAWASLFRSPGPPQTLLELWAHGLARNEAAPDDVQHGLLGLTHHLLWRSLPGTIVDAAIAHPPTVEGAASPGRSSAEHHG